MNPERDDLPPTGGGSNVILVLVDVVVVIGIVVVVPVVIPVIVPVVVLVDGLLPLVLTLRVSNRGTADRDVCAGRCRDIEGSMQKSKSNRPGTRRYPETRRGPIPVEREFFEGVRGQTGLGLDARFPTLDLDPFLYNPLLNNRLLHDSLVNYGYLDPFLHNLLLDNRLLDNPLTNYRDNREDPDEPVTTAGGIADEDAFPLRDAPDDNTGNADRTELLNHRLSQTRPATVPENKAIIHRSLRHVALDVEILEVPHRCPKAVVLGTTSLTLEGRMVRRPHHHDLLHAFKGSLVDLEVRPRETENTARLASIRTTSVRNELSLTLAREARQIALRLERRILERSTPRKGGRTVPLPPEDR